MKERLTYCPDPRPRALATAPLATAPLATFAASAPLAALAAFAALAPLAGCGSDATPCATGSNDDGSYTLAPGGDTCLEGVTTRRRVAGAWQAGLAAPRLEWQEGAAGGLRLTLVADAPSEGLELVIPGVDADRMLQQGYQSWGFSGTVLVPVEVPLDADGVATMEAARTGDPLLENLGVSSHSVVLRDGESGRVLVVAALSAERAVTGLAATRPPGGATRLSVVYGPMRELLPVDPASGELRGETLFVVAADSPEEGLEKLRAELIDFHAASGFTPKRPPGGWFSWNVFFDAVDETMVRAQLDVMETRLLPAGLPLVEIDDGWQLAWGDWQENEKFPDGLAPLAADITARGLVAGLWFAPFLVDVTSQAAGSDPSFFVQGADGQPLVHMISGNPRSFHVLDGSNPEAMRLVTDEIARLAAAGFTFFKLDFLYAGALAGGRAQDMTGVEALREGLRLIRAAAGPDAILNACGAPILPMLGHADSLRVGADTAFGGFPLEFTFIVGAARSLAARTHLWPLVWPDADQAQLRAPLTLDEARISALGAALSAAPYALGDDLATLEPARLELALDPALLDMAAAEAPATPAGLVVAPTDNIGLNPLLESVRNENGISTPPPNVFRITGKSGARYEVTFDWTGARTVSVATTPP